jgi:hypothetical protein
MMKREEEEVEEERVWLSTDKEICRSRERRLWAAAAVTRVLSSPA